MDPTRPIGKVSLNDKDKAMILRRSTPILRMACCIVVTGHRVAKKALLAMCRSLTARDGSVSIRPAMVSTEQVSSEANSTILMATGERVGREYPRLSFSSTSFTGFHPFEMWG